MSHLIELNDGSSMSHRLEGMNHPYISLYNPHGCEVTSLDLIRDDDVIIAANNSESFRKPGKKQIRKQTNMFLYLFEYLFIYLFFKVNKRLEQMHFLLFSKKHLK